jgi:hypothetical protein
MKMDANLKILCELQPNVLKRRLINEYRQLSLKYNDIDIIYNCISCETVIITINNCNNKFEFIIGKQYPFIKPSLIINDKLYLLEYLRMPVRFVLVYNKMYGNKCLCCSSLLCNKNWKPPFKMDDIIDEYNATYITKKNIIIKILSDTIVYKYLCSDIDLAQWLFTHEVRG